eukprot:gnl/TRDRNA2_/TRDRNA2_160721_c2_seq1.p1 gnl/TRDRNA2_/TRDRNA2_160721_c2~~gnl/TRDRNA2_/TRDRNA2_160721_c2_seq1.p1  ORF type:complete len:209 (-),score=14.83 gnl/TRDRNA2_/TRDRNA2_160721_c2_seq1:116-712(-)
MALVLSITWPFIPLALPLSRWMGERRLVATTMRVQLLQGVLMLFAPLSPVPAVLYAFLGTAARNTVGPTREAVFSQHPTMSPTTRGRTATLFVLVTGAVNGLAALAMPRAFPDVTAPDYVSRGLPFLLLALLNWIHLAVAVKFTWRYEAKVLDSLTKDRAVKQMKTWWSQEGGSVIGPINYLWEEETSWGMARRPHSD